MNREDFDLVIVGAGPAGIATALEAQRCGIRSIVVLEKGSSHSSMIRTFYKEGKRVDARYAGLEAICHGVLCLRDGNRESYLAFMDSIIQSNKIEIIYNTEVWSVEKKNSDLFEVTTNNGKLNTKNLVIAIGKMGRPRQPDYFKSIPVTLKRNDSILFDINRRDLSGLDVLVVGGGDSAGEYADMLHKDSRVSLSYRKENFERMNDLNAGITNKLIADKKIEVLIPSNVSKIEDIKGKPKVFFKEDRFAPKTFDAVLYALGGITPTTFLQNCRVQLDDKKDVIVNENKESSVSGLYIVGDLLGKANGGGSIIAGFNSAHKAVKHLTQTYLGKETPAEIVKLDHLNF